MRFFNQQRDALPANKKPNVAERIYRKFKSLWDKYAGTMGIATGFLLIGVHGLGLHLLNPIPDESASLH